jgi:hypothetical protein
MIGDRYALLSPSYFFLRIAERSDGWRQHLGTLSLLDPWVCVQSLLKFRVSSCYLFACCWLLTSIFTFM